MPEIKQIPEDFVVREIFRKKEPGEGGKTEDSHYVWFTLKKTNWSLFRAVKMISRKLGVSVKRFGYAGTKDKRAVTYQKVSVWNVPMERLESVRIKDIELSGFEERRERINLGDLKGNRFEITVRDIGKGKRKGMEKNLERIKREGMINFYGKQRFGVRGNTHLVGKEIIRDRLKEAVWTYLTHGRERERNEDARSFRENLEKGGDFMAAIKECPGFLGTEKTLLQHLAREPNDYAGALRRIPKKLRRIFVHAYQSYLWNEIAKVTEEKTIPIIGFDTDLSKYESGKEMKRILGGEGIKPGDFRLKSMPELSAEGSERKRIVRPKKLEWSFGEDEINEGKLKCLLKFGIPPGSYATVLVDGVLK